MDPHRILNTKLLRLAVIECLISQVSRYHCYRRRSMPSLRSGRNVASRIRARRTLLVRRLARRRDSTSSSATVSLAATSCVATPAAASACLNELAVVAFMFSLRITGCPLKKSVWFSSSNLNRLSRVRRTSSLLWPASSLPLKIKLKCASAIGLLHSHYSDAITLA